MTDRTDTRRDGLTTIEVAPEVDRSRCALCGAPNQCVMATPGRSATPADGPCWCVGRRFPAALTREATARDGGAACICSACLDASQARAGPDAVGSEAVDAAAEAESERARDA